MAAQQCHNSSDPGMTQRLWARCRARAWVRARPRWRSGALLISLLALLSLLPLGNASWQAHAAPADPSCPTWYSNGAARCAGTVTNTPTFNPPVGGVAWSVWYVCLSDAQTDDLFTQTIGGTYEFQIIGSEYQWGASPNDNWIVELRFWNDGTFSVITAYPAYNKNNVWLQPPMPVPNPNETPPPCPPLATPPPCATCLPQITAFDFWSIAPTPVISGQSTCPDGTVDNCPPSVGNRVQLWVDSWINPPGKRTCQFLGSLPDLYRNVTICMWWQAHSSTLIWNFDDETVDPTSGIGTPTSSVSGGGDPDHPVSHTFQYSSAYNPLRGCVRPCFGDVNGPNGSPAFQVTLSSQWDLFFSVSGQYWDGTPFFRSTLINLRQFGAPDSFFTERTVIPVSVFSYGSVNTP